MPKSETKVDKPTTKDKLLDWGIARVNYFCAWNKIEPPEIFSPSQWFFSECAYYRPDEGIRIYLPNCAYPTTEAQVRNWNWPGSTTDRTPYGVVCHELGHHCDWLAGTRRGRYYSEYSESLREASKEPAITSYAPNPAEWFAEIFRLFVTNPGLCKLLRPKTFDLVCNKYKPVPDNMNWINELGANCPQRIVSNLRKKIKNA